MADPAKMNTIEVFAHYSVVTGVVIGFTLTRVADFLANSVLARESQSSSSPRSKEEIVIRFVHCVWLVLVTSLVLQFWYSLTTWAPHLGEATFGEYCLSLSSPFLLYVVSVLLCPSGLQGEVKRNDYYLNRAKLFFPFAAMAVLATAIEAVVILPDQPWNHEKNLFRYVATGVLLCGAFLRNVWCQLAIACVMILLFVLYLIDPLDWLQ